MTMAIELCVAYLEGVGHSVIAGHCLPSGTEACHFRVFFISVEFNNKENWCLELKKVDLLFLKL